MVPLKILFIKTPRQKVFKAIETGYNFYTKIDVTFLIKKITLPQKWMTLWNEKYKKYTFDNRFKHIIFIGLFDSVFRADFRHSFVTSLG